MQGAMSLYRLPISKLIKAEVCAWVRRTVRPCLRAISRHSVWGSRPRVMISAGASWAIRSSNRFRRTSGVSPSRYSHSVMPMTIRRLLSKRSKNPVRGRPGRFTSGFVTSTFS